MTLDHDVLNVPDDYEVYSGNGLHLRVHEVSDIDLVNVQFHMAITIESKIQQFQCHSCLPHTPQFPNLLIHLPAYYLLVCPSLLLASFLK